MMAQSNFLQSLQNFQKDSINDETVEFLAPYLEAEDFNFETAKRVGVSMFGLRRVLYTALLVLV